MEVIVGDWHEKKFPGDYSTPLESAATRFSIDRTLESGIAPCRRLEDCVVPNILNPVMITLEMWDVQGIFPFFFFTTVHKFFTTESDAISRTRKVRQIIFQTFFLPRGITRARRFSSTFPQIAFSILVYCDMTKPIMLSKWWKTPSAKAAFRRVAAEKRRKGKLLVARFAAAKLAKARAMQLD